MTKSCRLPFRFLLPKSWYDFACYNMLSDILTAAIEENIVMLFKNNYFMMRCVLILVVGVEVYFCLHHNHKKCVGFSS